MELDIQKLKKQRDDAKMEQKYGEERFTKFKSTANKDLSNFKKSVKEKD